MTGPYREAGAWGRTERSGTKRPLVLPLVNRGKETAVRTSFLYSAGVTLRSTTRFIAVLSLLAGMAFAAVPPIPASASPTSACGYGSSGGNTRTCLSIGAGSVSTSATVISYGRTLRSCLRRDGARVVCTAYSYVKPGGGTGNTWVAGGSVPDGTYCAVTWRLYANGAQQKVGTECIGMGTTIIG
jgi:hypothetical protein